MSLNEYSIVINAATVFLSSPTVLSILPSTISSVFPTVTTFVAIPRVSMDKHVLTARSNASTFSLMLVDTRASSSLP